MESRGDVNEEPCLDSESVARKVVPYDHTVNTLELAKPGFLLFPSPNPERVFQR